MRRTVLSVLLAIMPALGLGVADPNQNASVASSAQEQRDSKPQAEKAPPVDPGGPADPLKLAPSKASPDAKNPAAAPVSEKTYVIGPQDQLGIMVWGQPAFSSITYLVRPDGFIGVPMLNEIKAGDKTPEELQKDIANRLMKFMKDPQVTVTVVAVHSKKYRIQGEVLKPGENDLVVPTTVLEGLVNAGGFKDFADQKHITVLRDNATKVLKFNYKEVIKGKNLQQNVYLQPGDIIIVK